jgi:hypothetical protein
VEFAGTTIVVDEPKQSVYIKLPLPLVELTA